MDTFTEFRNDVIASRDTNPIIQFTYGWASAFVTPSTGCSG